MRRRILAAVAAAAVVTGGTLAIAESPADAHGTCPLLHLALQNRDGSVHFLHLCL